MGCKHCYPAVATNLFHQTFPGLEQEQISSCPVEVKERTWPPVPGEYFALCQGRTCPVAVSTLTSVSLVERLASVRPKELCIVGKTETENIGVEKVIKNIISNPTIRFLLLVGKDSEGHQSGQTLLSLGENGIDARMKVIGSPGKHPILKNVTGEEVKIFREQVRVVDLIGCEDISRILQILKDLSQEPALSSTGKG